MGVAFQAMGWVASVGASTLLGPSTCERAGLVELDGTDSLFRAPSMERSLVCEHRNGQIKI